MPRYPPPSHPLPPIPKPTTPLSEQKYQPSASTANALNKLAEKQRRAHLSQQISFAAENHYRTVPTRMLPFEKDDSKPLSIRRNVGAKAVIMHQSPDAHQPKNVS